LLGGVAHRCGHHQRQHVRRDVDQGVLPGVEQRLERRRHVVDAIVGRQDLEVLLPDALVAGIHCGRFYGRSHSACESYCMAPATLPSVSWKKMRWPTPTI